MISLQPQTGNLHPQYDAKSVERAGSALSTMSDIVIPYGPQLAIAGRIGVLHARSLGRIGRPLQGLRLSQVSQAGKTKTLETVRRRIMKTTILESGEANPFQVLYINLEVRITAKILFVQLLRMLGDPHAEQGNIEEVKRRTDILMRERGVELLMVDEVQHLARESRDKVDVTDELKRFLDMGICPVVFAGNEDLKPFFERNQQLASRLGAPLELTPVDAHDGGQLSNFKRFCGDLDDELVTTGVMNEQSGFLDSEMLNALLFASGGHIGRVFRIVESAVEHAALRQASRVEPYDVSYAIDNFAIPGGYVSRNPMRGSRG